MANRLAKSSIPVSKASLARMMFATLSPPDQPCSYGARSLFYLIVHTLV
ncbi:hypothetical protein FHT86_003216 [Rhizobium sp. BK313]|nr:hypothetical protein [Rhizobium sp. BK313]